VVTQGQPYDPEALAALVMRAVLVLQGRLEDADRLAVRVAEPAP
jgi:hypothetical protein